MVAWFIIAIATLAVFAFIAVNGVQTVAMTSDAAARVETVRRLDAVVNGLLSRAVDVGGTGVVYLPVGQANPTGEGYGLPADLALMSVTPFGQRFVYCPFGDVGGTGTTLSIPQASASSYNVATQTVNGETYVVGGRPAFQGLSANPNIIAFVLAPRSKLSPTPNCSDVVYDTTNKRFGAQNAVVRAVSRNAGVDEARTINTRTVTYWVSPSGTGTGASEADPASLATALAFYRSNLPMFMTIKLESGNYLMQPADLNIADESGRQANLTIQHEDGTANMSQIDMNGPGTIAIPGDLTLEAVMIDTDATVTVADDRMLKVKNATTGPIQVSGTAIFRGTNVINQDASSWVLYVASGGKAQFDYSTTRFNAANVYGVFVSNGGKLVSQVSTLLVGRTSGTLSYGFYSYTGGELEFMNSSVQFLSPVSYGFYPHGRLDMWGSNVHFQPGSNMAIAMRPGSSVALHASTIGLSNRPSYGVYDYGALGIAGQGSTEIFAGRCWNGVLFNESQSPLTDGSSSAVLGQVTPAPLPASPTAAQIQAYADTQADNARRSVLASVNRSIWTCRPL